MTEESPLGQALPPGFPAPFLFADGLSSVETLLTNIQVRSQPQPFRVLLGSPANWASASGPAEGGRGKCPRAGQTDPGGEEGAEDGAVSREGDEGEPGTAAHLRAPEQRCERRRARSRASALQSMLAKPAVSTASIQKRLKKEKKAKRKLQEALEFESKRRERVEDALKHSSSSSPSPEPLHANNSDNNNGMTRNKLMLIVLDSASTHCKHTSFSLKQCREAQAALP